MSQVVRSCRGNDFIIIFMFDLVLNIFLSAGGFIFVRSKDILVSFEWDILFLSDVNSWDIVNSVKAYLKFLEFTAFGQSCNSGQFYPRIHSDCEQNFCVFMESCGLNSEQR